MTGVVQYAGHTRIASTACLESLNMMRISLRAGAPAGNRPTDTNCTVCTLLQVLYLELPALNIVSIGTKCQATIMRPGIPNHPHKDPTLAKASRSTHAEKSIYLKLRHLQGPDSLLFSNRHSKAKAVFDAVYDTSRSKYSSLVELVHSGARRTNSRFGNLDVANQGRLPSWRFSI